MVVLVSITPPPNGTTECRGGGRTATIADDGTADPRWSTAVLAEHLHQDSFALDAPRPWSWSVHS